MLMLPMMSSKTEVEESWKANAWSTQEEQPWSPLTLTCHVVQLRTISAAAMGRQPCSEAHR